MLFNSYAFLLAFLPLTLIGFGLARRFGGRAASLGVLLVASFAFYAYWRLDHFALFSATVVANYFAGRLVARGGPRAKAWCTLAVLANLGVLFAYKYTGFVLENAAQIAGQAPPPWDVVLPLGISFYTFQQIAYLVDCYKSGEAEPSFREYALFVSFFPQLIAGPIVHHSATRPQFAALRSGPIDLRLPAAGLTLLVLGLAKKVLVADNLASYASPVFDAADAGAAIGPAAAWAGALAYTLQIYFDFSGYSDIAIGLGLLFGIYLPINFDSPYKATSIVDFWRRWHITLSTWLRDYVYIPLGGNRGGELSRLRNVFLTMLIGGIWHGAGWTFVIWGALHGTYITANHVLRRALPGALAGPAWVPVKRLVTLLLVIGAWVLFRATTLGGAFEILVAMAGGGEAGPDSAATDPTLLPWLVGAGSAALFAPNALELVGYPKAGPGAEGAPGLRAPSFAVSLGVGLLFALVLASVWRPTVFIYFNF